MKRGFLRAAGGLAAGLAGVVAAIIAVNFVMFGFAVGYLSRTEGGRVRVSEYAEALSQDEDGVWTMAAEKAETLHGRGCWAMLLDAGGGVVWSQDMPDSLPRAYSPAQVAAFSRWYLSDWPVKVWSVGDGLFVLAQPKGSEWKYQVEMPTEQVGFWPVWGAAMLAVNAGLLLGAAAFITHRAAQRRDAARSEWIAAISHDVRTPLSMVLGYAAALEAFDAQLPQIQAKMGEDDLLIITADHGCDPCHSGTDHTREHTPLLVWSKKMQGGANLGVRATYADINATVLDYFGLANPLHGVSFLKELK